MSDVRPPLYQVQALGHIAGFYDEFILSVKHRLGLVWCVRYSFQSLEQWYIEIEAEFKSLTLAPFPERVWFRPTTPLARKEFLNTRQSSLEACLNAVFKHEEVAAHRLVTELLCVLAPEPPGALRVARRQRNLLNDAMDLELEVRTEMGHASPIEEFCIELFLDDARTTTVVPAAEGVTQCLWLRNVPLGQLRFSVSAANKAGSSPGVEIAVDTTHAKEAVVASERQSESGLRSGREGWGGGRAPIMSSPSPQGWGLPEGEVQDRTTSPRVRPPEPASRTVPGPTQNAEFHENGGHAGRRPQCSGARSPNRDLPSWPREPGRLLPARSPLSAVTNIGPDEGLGAPRRRSIGGAQHVVGGARSPPPPSRLSPQRATCVVPPARVLEPPRAHLDRWPQRHSLPQESILNVHGRTARSPSPRRVVVQCNVGESAHDDSMCVVCLGTPASHAFIPCGHRCVCAECSEVVLQATGDCPLCRQKATSSLHIFT